MPLSDSADRPLGWDYFDRIYCISLAERADRRVLSEQQFKSVGLYERVEYILVDRHPQNSEQGIYESHVTCLRRGLAAGAQNMLIFEDDVIFQRFSAEHLAACTFFLRAHADWKAFFLGCLVRRSRKTNHPAVQAISYRCMAHAYVVNKSFASEIISKPWSGKPYDTMLRQCNDGFFAAYPTFAFQSNSPSDNSRHKTLDTFRRWCGGLTRIQKANEWCHRHYWQLVIWHILGLVALLALAMWVGQ